MTHKQLFSLLFINFSLHIHAGPTNTPQKNYYIQQCLLQPIQAVQEHPKKAIASPILFSLGIGFINKGTETRNINPDNYGAYNRIGIGQQLVGSACTVIGAVLFFSMLYDILSTKNTCIKKTNTPELSDKK